MSIVILISITNNLSTKPENNNNIEKPKENNNIINNNDILKILNGNNQQIINKILSIILIKIFKTILFQILIITFIIIYLLSINKVISNFLKLKQFFNIVFKWQTIYYF